MIAQHFHDHFSRLSVLAGSPSKVSKENVVGTVFSQARCPPSYPNSSIKALKNDYCMHKINT